MTDREAFPPAGSLRSVFGKYRAHIAARNHESLKIYVDLIEKCPPPPNTAPEILNSPDRIRKIRLDSLCKLLCVTPPIMDAYMSSGIWADDPNFNFMAEELGVVLKYWKFLPERLGLDGVVWKRFRPKLFGTEPGKRDGYAFPRPTPKHRTRGGSYGQESLGKPKDYLEVYFEEIEKQLRETCIPRLKTTISFPEDLRRLSLFGVDGLDGPGLGGFKRREGVVLWSGFSDCLEVENLDDPDSYREVVEQIVKDAPTAEIDELSGMNKYHWVDVTICAVYAATRKRRPDFGAGSPGVNEYHWRFTVTDWKEGSDHEEFASIKGLLDWGMRYREERFLVDAGEIRA